MDLAFDDHRVDARTAIVEGVEATDIGDAGVDVDVDHADIGAKRIGHVGRIVVADRLQTGLQAGDRLIVGSKGDLGHGLGALGIALDLEAIDVPFQIVVMHLQQVGGDHLRLGADLPPGHGGRGTGNRGRARAVGAETVGGGVGVAFLDGDVFSGDADLGGEDLGKGGGVALALADGTEACDRRARRVDADLAGIEHAEAEDVAVLDGPGTDDLGEEGTPTPSATGFRRARRPSRLAACSARSFW